MILLTLGEEGGLVWTALAEKSNCMGGGGTGSVRNIIRRCLGRVELTWRMIDDL